MLCRSSVGHTPLNHSNRGNQQDSLTRVETHAWQPRTDREFRQGGPGLSNMAAEYSVLRPVLQYPIVYYNMSEQHMTERTRSIAHGTVLV